MGYSSMERSDYSVKRISGPVKDPTDGYESYTHVDTH